MFGVTVSCMHYTVIRSDARYETTAAWQAAESSTAELQKEVEKNAKAAHNVAEEAAAEAGVSSWSLCDPACILIQTNSTKAHLLELQ